MKRTKTRHVFANTLAGLFLWYRGELDDDSLRRGRLEHVHA